MRQDNERRKKYLELLYDRYKTGQGLRQRDLIRAGHDRIYQYARLKYGSYRSMLVAAGIPDDEVDELLLGGKYPTKESVVLAIQERYREGKGLRCRDLRQDGDEVLYHRGRVFFKTWRTALVESGIPEEDVDQVISSQEYQDKDDVVKKLQELRKDGVSLTISGLTDADELYVTRKAREYFGSWAEALKAAGVDGEDVQWVLNRERYATKEKVLAALRERKDSGKGLRFVDLEKDGEWSLYNKAREFYGSLRQALQEIGVDIAELKYQDEEKIEKKKSEVIEVIRERVEAGKGIRRKDLKETDDHKLLYEKGVRLFGTWRKAILESGYTEQETTDLLTNRKYKDKEAVIQEIQRLHREGEGTASSDIQKRKDFALYRSGIIYFGSWQEVLRQSGINK